MAMSSAVTLRLLARLLRPPPHQLQLAACLQSASQAECNDESDSSSIHARLYHTASSNQRVGDCCSPSASRGGLRLLDQWLLAARRQASLSPDHHAPHHSFRSFKSLGPIQDQDTAGKDKGGTAGRGGPGSSLEQAGEKMKDAEILQRLVGYLWPHDNPEFKRRMMAAVCCLVAAKVLNVSVPFFMKVCNLPAWIFLHFHA